MSFPIIPLQEAIESLSRRPGLILGPDATCSKDVVSQLVLNAARIAGANATDLEACDESGFRRLMDKMCAGDSNRMANAEREYLDGLRDLRGNLDLPHLARAGWAACISLTTDLLFETALRNYLDATPTSRTTTVVDCLSVDPPDRTTPTFKLLGNVNSQIDESRLVTRDSALLLRQQAWPFLLRKFPDYIHEAPVFVVGTGPVIPFLRTVLSVLLQLPKPSVRRLVFLKDDPALADATVEALCRNYVTQVVDASLREVCQGISEIVLQRPTMATIAAAAMPIPDLARVLSANESFLSIVPKGTVASGEIERNQLALVDSLFRPTAVDWAPFLAGLDLRRSVTDRVLDAIRQHLNGSRSTHPKFVVTYGDAGIGKTMVLKRVASELAQEGRMVFWLRRSQSDNWIRHYRKLATDLGDAFGKTAAHTADPQLVLICDDPWGLRLDAGELLACFENVPYKIVMAFSVRSSAYFTTDGIARAIGSVPHSEIPIPFELDDAEVELLPKMLLRIGAVKSETAGVDEIRKVRSRNARDILCSLWYLVPETRSQLRDSLRDEYCRLGDVREVIGTAAQSASVSSSAALKAYEYVTVASNLDIGVPVEVLVRALQIDYADWIEMTGNGRPLWGLIYDEHDPERQTLVYRTRNEVITRVLLDLVNGGVGHSGEVRVLKELLNACAAGGHVYRTFVLDVLVRGRGKLSKYLTYEQGVELYDIARQALPYPDRVIEHHKGIWIDDVGRRHADAYRQFEAALHCRVYPGAERDAPREHIHTSMAATAVRMVKDGELGADKGYELVRDHLRQAASPTFFNGHTAHVAANLLFELAQHAKEGSRDQVSLRSLTEALQEIEKGRQLIGAHGRNQFKQERSIAMLDDLQRRILTAIPNIDVLEELARKMVLEDGSQVGLEASARRRLADAILSDKGRAYNEVNQYLIECFGFLAEKKLDPSPNLLLVRVDLVVRWRLQRPSGAVDWRSFRDDLHAIISVPRFRDDLVKQFYFAVAQFHCNDITSANATFAGLRRLALPAHSPNAIRMYLRGGDGNLRRLQGTLERKNQIYYFMIPELNTSVQARAHAAEGGPGATVHSYLGFSLNGPVAVFSSPTETETLLP
ncbi:MAG: hypothetical protein AB7O31_11850 [Burkholderiales bacterium]